MTDLVLTDTGADRARSLFGFCAALWSRFERRRQRARAVEELRLCSDHMLADIGINRGDIFAAVHGECRR
ncbi:MAG TPA: DUF1127 domain-containing protein [Stellaceae bacterium]|nr:DUF1127 domain-containing protein [Stellaceae bacterium]